MNAQSDPTRNNDIELWRRVVADDRAAFEEVVVKYQNLVASVAFSTTGNFSLSEEVTQETFWQAWRQRLQLRRQDRLAAWLCGIARNMALQTSKTENRQSARYRVEGVGSSENDPALNSISAEERKIVWQTLEEIPQTYREALVLFYREGHSISEVAMALEVSLDVAKQRVHRGRESLRASLAGKVEEVLVRSRPGTALTARVMVGLAALGTSLKATSTATGATLSSASAAEMAKAAAINSAGGIAAATTKSILAGAGAGALGGLAGAIAGLGGAALGCWVPAQMAETLEERKLLEKHGRRSFALCVAYTLTMLCCTPLLWVYHGVFWYFGCVAAITMSFMTCLLVFSVIAQRQYDQLRAALPPNAELSPSPLRRKVGLDQVVYRGRRYTSRLRFLGVPLIDIQFNDIGAPASVNPQSGKAFGWIALGDRATGLLFAAGGISKGLVALGGLAFGGIAVGGVAVGAIAIGGVALGALALGGAALGYDAAGGLAVAWHAASGGGALAYHLAVGGAMAREFAVGSGAWANEANTATAKALAESQSMIWLLEWIVRHQIIFITVTVAISLLPLVLLKLAYRREQRTVLRTNRRLYHSPR